MLSKKKQPCISNGALSLKQLKGLQGNRGSLKMDFNGAGDPKSEKDKDFVHVIVNFSKKKKKNGPGVEVTCIRFKFMLRFHFDYNKTVLWILLY